MGFTDIKDIEEAVRTKEKELNPLYERFNNDYKKHWLMEPFQLGKKGEYANYTTNELHNLASKVVDTLSKAPVKFQVPISDENEKKRKESANDERFGYGVTRLANEGLRAIMQPSIQSQSSFFAPVRGWVGGLAVLNKTDDDKRNTYPVARIWDILNTTWGLGRSELDWACHTRYIKESNAKAEFPDANISGDVAVRDYWDTKWHITYIVSGGKLRKFLFGGKRNEVIRQEHNIGHIPVLITQVGSAPYIQAIELSDTISAWGESIFAPDRNIVDVKNELITLLRTIVKMGAHNPLAVTFDGSGGAAPPLFDKNPYYSGSIVYLDRSKGEEVKELYKPEMPKDTSGLLSVVQHDLDAGGAASILKGQTPFPSTGIGTSLLMEAASSILYPSQKCVEEVLEWIVNELKVQYHGGGYNKMKLRGWDSSNKYFDIIPGKDDVSDDRHIQATLMPKLPEDEWGKVRSAATLAQNNLMSIQSIMDRYISVEDTDAEMGNIYKEKGNLLPVVLKMRIAAALLKDRPDKPELAFAVLQEAAQGGGNGGSPEAGRLQPGGGGIGSPAEIEEDLRLARMGMTRGR